MYAENQPSIQLPWKRSVQFTDSIGEDILLNLELRSDNSLDKCAKGKCDLEMR